MIIFSTLSPRIMVQWKLAGYLKGNDPIGDTPIFHWNHDYGRKCFIVPNLQYHIFHFTQKPTFWRSNHRHPGPPVHAPVAGIEG